MNATPTPTPAAAAAAKRRTPGGAELGKDAGREAKRLAAASF
jgi:hypothetical protein